LVERFLDGAKACPLFIPRQLVVRHLLPEFVLFGYQALDAVQDLAVVHIANHSSTDG
jgi:hypothetical protein